MLQPVLFPAPAQSSSTRGTWIEIDYIPRLDLLPESSSTRGTWIEIRRLWADYREDEVVLHTGDVD